MAKNEKHFVLANDNTVLCALPDITAIRVNPAAKQGSVLVNVFDQDSDPEAGERPLIGGELDQEEVEVLIGLLAKASGLDKALLEAAQFVEEFGAGGDEDDDNSACERLVNNLKVLAGVR